MSRREVRVVEAELGERADLEVFQHHVGAGGELLDDAPPLFAVEIKLDRPLAAIGAVEIGGVEVTAVGAGHERRPPGPGVVADALAFDLDHVGAEIGEDLPGPRTRQNTGKLEHAQTGQRTWHEQLLYKGAL